MYVLEIIVLALVPIKFVFLKMEDLLAVVAKLATVTIMLPIPAMVRTTIYTLIRHVLLTMILHNNHRYCPEIS